MTQVAEDKTIHLVNFSGFAKTAGDGLPWLDALRRSAISQFDAAGFPTTHQEEWRFTNVSAIARMPFGLAGPDESDGAAKTATQFSFAKESACEIVFVNGHYSPQLSKLGKSAAGLRVMSLAAALKTHPALLEEHLGQLASTGDNPFTALNTGFIRDGAVVHLAKGAAVNKPIHLLFVSMAGDRPAVSHPRVLIVAEDGARATIVESYVGTSGVYFTNAVAEVVTGDNVIIDHCRLQQESLEAFHISAMKVRLGRATQFVSQSASIGSRLTRNQLDVILDGEGTHATVNGLVIVGGQQHIDNHTLLVHEKANCTSHELYKHVLDDHGTAVFKGKIFVQKDAQKTDSKQTSKSLLLSDDATMDSMPALEIYADDVKCTHGSTTGPVDEEMVFYLRTRGVSYEAARHLLTYAFAADITRRIKVEPVRRRLEDFMAAQHGLPRDLRISDLGEHDEVAR